MNCKKIDELNKPWDITDDEECIYIREHIEGGYEASRSNQLIFNLKKPIDRRNTLEWQYKEEAIKKFADELSFVGFPEGAILVPMPTSKPNVHGQYDNRIIRVAEEFQKFYRPDIVIRNIIDVTKPIPPAHQGGSRRRDFLSDHIALTDNGPITSKYIFLLDDVITTGAHFNVCQHLLQEEYPQRTVIGVFWALHVFGKQE